MKHLKKTFALLLLLAISAINLNAAITINWWHAMEDKLGEKVNEIADNFNKSQSEFEVVPTYKGNYTETMTSGIAAFRAKKSPHIIQVFEVGTANMMAAKGAIYPVYKLMKDTRTPFNPDEYLQAVTGYYSDTKGNMLSLPFNSSTPVLYYNKDLFTKAGLNPNTPPKTWNDVETYAKKLQASGVPCGFTTGWQSWVQLENFSAWHNLPFGSAENGFGSSKAKLTFNGPTQVRHINNMANWQKSKIFDYGGRRSDSGPKFYSQECAMYMNSSASLAGIKANATFELGVGMLPYYDDVKSSPQNSIIGGATLWVFSGHSKKEYEGVAKFFSFLSSPEIQADWHQATGYLPITYAAYELSKKQGYYDQNPGADTSIKQITYKQPTPNSKGLRFGNFVQIRDVLNEEFESVWNGSKTAKQALDSAVKRGNRLIDKFNR